MVKDGKKAGIIVGVGAGLAALIYLATRAKAAVPPTEPEPGLANLYGIVTNAETGDPLAGVRIELWSPDGIELIHYTGTNSSGSYLMANILPGNYLAQFSKEGFETATY